MTYMLLPFFMTLAAYTDTNIAIDVDLQIDTDS